MLRRPTTIEELKQRLALFSTEESKQHGLSYQARATDTFIATYPKCGTTWVQQLVHCLRTGGDMDFAEITEVVPWLELSHDLGMDNTSKQKARPHAFKSHFHWQDIPKGGRYIHVTRNAKDVLLSFYRFFEGWFFEKNSIDLETFATQFFLHGSASGKYWHHINAWWPQRNRDDVLFLAYENMMAEPERLIRCVADFIDITLSDDLLVITKEKISAAFMRKHVNQFNDHILRNKRDPICGLPSGGDSAKISTQNTNKLTPSPFVLTQLEQKWHDIVTPETGLKNYEELLAKL